MSQHSLTPELLAAYRDGEQAIPPMEGDTKFIGTDVYAVQRVAGRSTMTVGGRSYVSLPGASAEQAKQTAGATA